MKPMPRWGSLASAVGTFVAVLACGAQCLCVSAKHACSGSVLDARTPQPSQCGAGAQRRTCPGSIRAVHNALPCRCWLEVAVDERLGDAPDGEGLSPEPMHAGAAASAGPPANGKGGAAVGEGAAAAEPWPPAKCALQTCQSFAWRAAALAQRASGGHRACARGRLGA